MDASSSSPAAPEPPPTRGDACRQISCALLALLALGALCAWLLGSIGELWAGGTEAEVAQLINVERHVDHGEYDEVTLWASYAYVAGGERRTFEVVLPEGEVPETRVVRYWRRDPGARYSASGAAWGVVWRWTLGLLSGGLALVFGCSIPLSLGEWFADGKRRVGGERPGKPGGLLLSLLLAGLCFSGAYAGYRLARGVPLESEVEARFLYGAPSEAGYEAVVAYELPGLNESLKASLLLESPPAAGAKLRLNVLAGQPGWFPGDVWTTTRAVIGWGAVLALLPLGALLALVFATGVGGRSLREESA